MAAWNEQIIAQHLFVMPVQSSQSFDKLAAHALVPTWSSMPLPMAMVINVVGCEVQSCSGQLGTDLPRPRRAGRVMAERHRSARTITANNMLPPLPNTHFGPQTRNFTTID